MKEDYFDNFKKRLINCCCIVTLARHLGQLSEPHLRDSALTKHSFELCYDQKDDIVKRILDDGKKYKKILDCNCDFKWHPPQIIGYVHVNIEFQMEKSRDDVAYMIEKNCERYLEDIIFDRSQFLQYDLKIVSILVRNTKKDEVLNIRFPMEDHVMKIHMIPGEVIYDL